MLVQPDNSVLKKLTATQIYNVRVTLMRSARVVGPVQGDSKTSFQLSLPSACRSLSRHLCRRG